MLRVKQVRPDRWVVEDEDGIVLVDGESLDVLKKRMVNIGKEAQYSLVEAADRLEEARQWNTEVRTVIREIHKAWILEETV